MTHRTERWIEELIGKCLSIADSPEQLEEMQAEVPKVREYLRRVGPGLTHRVVGEQGKYLRDVLSTEQLAELDHRHQLARRRHIETARLLGHDLDCTISPSDDDAWYAGAGADLYKSCPKPERFEDFISAGYRKALNLSEENARAFLESIGDDCAAKAMQSAAMWAKCAFPFVVFRNPRWPAALMMTSVPPELAKEVVPPWKAFRVALPAGLLSVENDGKNEPCQRMMVMYSAEEGWTIVVNGTTRMMHMTGETTEQLCEGFDPDKMNVSDDPGLSLSGPDGRCMRLAARLALGICMSFDAAVAKSVKRHRIPGALKHRREGNKEPEARTYVMGRPVQVDAAEAVREYLQRGRGKPKTVQWLRRGHWRHQPYGPQSSLRKFIHIEPCWCGRKDAPIAVRPHILTGGNKAAE